MSNTIHIEEVSDKAGLKRFVRLVPPLYKDDPNFIIPLELERLELLDRKKNPYFEHADAAFFIAVRNGKDIGRLSAQVCELVDTYQSPDIGHFGFFECINDANVAQALFGAASDWLRARGKARAIGPFSPNVNTEIGLLIDGFDTPPRIMMGHGLPYYQNLIESAGFDKAKDLFAYVMPIDTPPPKIIKRVLRMAHRNEKLTCRQVSKKNFDKEAEIIFDIFNDAWSENWGFVPFTDHEAKHTAETLKLLLKEECAVIYEDEGHPIAFLVVLPDINDWIKDLGGRLLPFGWAKLIWRLKTAPWKKVRVPLMGVRKDYQSKPVGASVAFDMIEICRQATLDAGGETSELGWILEDNKGMNDILVLNGAEVYKTYRMYEKALG